MGYAWNGVCHETAEGALLAFAKSIPQSDGSAIATFAEAPTIDASGLVTWSITHRSLADDAPTLRTGMTQLPTCDLPLMDQVPVQSLVFAAAVFFALVHGWSSGYRP